MAKRMIRRFTLRQKRVLVGLVLVQAAALGAYAAGYEIVALAAVLGTGTLLLGSILLVKNKLEHEARLHRKRWYIDQDQFKRLRHRLPDKPAPREDSEHVEFMLRRVLAAVEDERYQNTIRFKELERTMSTETTKNERNE